MKPWYVTPWIVISLCLLVLIILVLIAWVIYKRSKSKKFTKRPKALLAPLYSRRELKEYMDKVFVSMPQIQDAPIWIDWAELKHKMIPRKYGYLVDFDSLRDKLGMELKDGQLPKKSHKHDEELEQLDIHEFLQEQQSLFKERLDKSLEAASIEWEKAEREYLEAARSKAQRRRNVRIPKNQHSSVQTRTNKTFLYVGTIILLLGIWGVLFLLLFNK